MRIVSIIAGTIGAWLLIPLVAAVLICRVLGRDQRRSIGEALHPDEITDAWYAADCPPKLRLRQHKIPVGVFLRWRLACWLRRWS